MSRERENHSLAQSYAQAGAGLAAGHSNEISSFARSAKRDFNPNEPHLIDDPLGVPMTIREVALLLGCSAWTVRQRHLRCGLPFFRIGMTGKLLFYRKQVVQWILQNQEKERR